MENNPTNGTPAVKVTKKASRSTLPSKHADLLAQAEQVYKTWLTKPNYVLHWTTCTDFGNQLASAQNTFNNRLEKGGSRKIITSTLKTLDEEIDKNVSTLKSYLTSKYKSESAGRPYYGQFGIQSISGTYKLPIDRNERLASLRLVKTAIVSEGFSNMELGKTYWETMYANYKNLIDSAISTDSQVSDNVGNKNTQADDIKKVLNSMIHLIKANNPETYESELLTWGFRKDRF